MAPEERPSDQAADEVPGAPGELPDGVPAAPGEPSADDGPDEERITEPGKLLRIVAMAHQLLDELHHDGLDVAARTIVHDSQLRALDELRHLLPPESRDELARLRAPLEDTGSPPTGTELRIAEAQLSGWLDGLLEALEAGEAAQQVGAEVRQAAELRRSYEQGDEPGRSGRPPF